MLKKSFSETNESAVAGSNTGDWGADHTDQLEQFAIEDIESKTDSKDDKRGHQSIQPFA